MMVSLIIVWQIITHLIYLVILYFVNNVISVKWSGRHQEMVWTYEQINTILIFKGQVLRTFINWELYQREILSFSCQIWIKLFMLWFPYMMMTVIPPFLVLALMLSVIQLIQKAAARRFTRLRNVSHIPVSHGSYQGDSMSQSQQDSPNTQASVLLHILKGTPLILIALKA